jgi:hypothetical protein
LRSRTAGKPNKATLREKPAGNRWNQGSCGATRDTRKKPGSIRRAMKVRMKNISVDEKK